MLLHTLGAFGLFTLFALRFFLRAFFLAFGFASLGFFRAPQVERNAVGVATIRFLPLLRFALCARPLALCLKRFGFTLTVFKIAPARFVR